MAIPLLYQSRCKNWTRHHTLPVKPPTTCPTYLRADNYTAPQAQTGGLSCSGIAFHKSTTSVSWFWCPLMPNLHELTALSQILKVRMPPIKMLQPALNCMFIFEVKGKIRLSASRSKSKLPAEPVQPKGLAIPMCVVSPLAPVAQRQLLNTILIIA